MLRVLIATFSLLVLSVHFAPDGDGTVKPNISNAAEINRDLAGVPCDDSQRQSSARRLFESFGATPDDLTVDKWSNIVVVKKGQGSGRIMIGAHYDKTGNGSCGATDNWTGIVAVSHIYKALRQVETKKTIVFVGFANEEKGLVGSKEIARRLSKEETREYCAMVNIDSLGLTTSQALTPISSPSLVKLSAATAAELKIKFAPYNIQGASSDSAPFLFRNIPAITLSGIANNWMDVFHTKRDQIGLVKPDLVYEGYLLALNLALKLDEAECRSYK